MKKLILTAVTILALGISTSAMAGTATDNMLVSLEVFGSCTVSTADLDFGLVSRLAATVADSTADITVNCTTDTVYFVALDAGLNDDGTSRRMAGPPVNFISYTLEDGFGNPWGDDVLYGNRVQGLGNNADQIIPVTGSVLGWVAGVSPNGVYTDTVAVTVEY